MNGTLCRVLFDGSIEQGRDIVDVKQTLSSIFKKDVSAIEHFFTAKAVGVKKDIDLATARKYKKAFLKGGAICRIVPDAPQLRVIAPRKISPALQLPPQQSPFLSCSDSGIDFKRKVMDPVPFSSLARLSVFSEFTAMRVVRRLVLFLKGFSLPFITEAERIKFIEFPGAFADWIQLGLQNIVAFVAAIVLLGLPSLGLALRLVCIVIAVIGGVTGSLVAIPGVAAGGRLGIIVGIIRKPSIPKIGSRMKK